MKLLEIREAALRLPDSEKAELADLLMDSIADEEHANEWIKLASQRSSEMRNNAQVGRPLSDFISELKSRSAKS